MLDDFLYSRRLFIFSTTFYTLNDFFQYKKSTKIRYKYCRQNTIARGMQSKMAARNLEQFDDISSACEVAAQALQAIGNLSNSDIRNLAESTASNSSASNSNMSSTSGGNMSAFAAELGQRFPTFNAGKVSTILVAVLLKTPKKRKSINDTHDAGSRSGAKIGRPSKSVIHKDLVIIPNPDTKQVPSHSSKVKLEERGLIIHEFPFNKGWRPLELRENIEKQLPKNVSFEFMKV